MEDKEKLKEILFRKMEELSEEQLRSVDIFLDYLLNEMYTNSGNQKEDLFLKKLDEKRKNDRTKFL
ncbi:hypothetical protein [Sporocytophaga myxococcoides]|uniref:hypothetical protein n=1 Tax=Sporocytophaga myxococcoides TaxID=153721 RepID=UPI0003FFBA7D|nr:hypothetical protein [Sporocytophaga myxococcoides]